MPGGQTSRNRPVSSTGASIIRTMTTAAGTDQLEVEWQYSVADTEAVARWLQQAAVPGYTLEPGKTKDLADTYLDTADWRIHRARFTCR